MASLQLQGLVKDFDSIRVIHGVDLAVADGEFVVFVGPSGCGKSTLLRLICGLEDASAGQILIDGQAVTHLRAADRGLAMVFQSYALYPHMTVAQNMAFGLENIATPKAEIARKVGDAAKLLQLDALLQRKPTQLSGGQRQRVAIGRAIVREPKIFLFDEPLSNLDAELRVTMRAEISALHRRLGATMVYVTHDQTEAMTMADKIVVLRAGRIEQVGTPLDLYNQPANRFVAGFIGSPRMNFIPLLAGPQDTLLHASGCRLLRPGLGLAAGAAVTLGVRPEHITLADQGEGLALRMQVHNIEQLGGHSMLQGQLAGSDTPLTVQCPGQVATRIGDTLPVWLPAARCHLFSTADGDPALQP